MDTKRKIILALGKRVEEKRDVFRESVSPLVIARHYEDE